jgi:hypothetical protein
LLKISKLNQNLLVLRRKIEKQIKRDFRSKKRKEEDNTTKLIAEGFSPLTMLDAR